MLSWASSVPASSPLAFLPSSSLLLSFPSPKGPLADRYPSAR